MKAERYFDTAPNELALSRLSGADMFRPSVGAYRDVFEREHSSLFIHQFDEGEQYYAVEPPEYLSNDSNDATKEEFLIHVLRHPLLHKEQFLWPVDYVDAILQRRHISLEAEDKNRKKQPQPYLLFAEKEYGNMQPLGSLFDKDHHVRPARFDFTQAHMDEKTAKLVCNLLEAFIELDLHGYIHRELSDKTIRYNPSSGNVVIDFSSSLCDLSVVVFSAVPIKRRNQRAVNEYSDPWSLQSSEESSEENIWVDKSSELHAIAALLFRLTIGRLPYHGNILDSQAELWHKWSRRNEEGHEGLYLEWLEAYHALASDKAPFIFGDDSALKRTGYSKDKVWTSPTHGGDDFEKLWNALSEELRTMFHKSLTQKNALRSEDTCQYPTPTEWYQAFRRQFEAWGFNLRFRDEEGRLSLEGPYTGSLSSHEHDKALAREQRALQKTSGNEAVFRAAVEQLGKEGVLDSPADSLLTFLETAGMERKLCSSVVLLLKETALPDYLRNPHHLVLLPEANGLVQAAAQQTRLLKPDCHALIMDILCAFDISVSPHFATASFPIRSNVADETLLRTRLHDIQERLRAQDQEGETTDEQKEFIALVDKLESSQVSEDDSTQIFGRIGCLLADTNRIEAELCLRYAVSKGYARAAVFLGDAAYRRNRREEPYRCYAHPGALALGWSYVTPQPDTPASEWYRLKNIKDILNQKAVNQRLLIFNGIAFVLLCVFLFIFHRGLVSGVDVGWLVLALCFLGSGAFFALALRRFKRAPYSRAIRYFAFAPALAYLFYLFMLMA
jgi:hypothetical protein